MPCPAHRRCANVLLSSKGDVKISDFGVTAKLTNTIQKRNTFVGSVGCRPGRDGPGREGRCVVCESKASFAHLLLPVCLVFSLFLHSLTSQHSLLDGTRSDQAERLQREGRREWSTPDFAARARGLCAGFLRWPRALPDRGCTRHRLDRPASARCFLAAADCSFAFLCLFSVSFLLFTLAALVFPRAARSGRSA